MTDPAVVYFPPELHPEYPLGAWREVHRMTETDTVNVPVEVDEAGQVVYEQRAVEREVDVPGRLMVVVNLAPEHPGCGACAFEPYTGDPADYAPSRNADPSEAGYLDAGAADAAYTAQRAEDLANRKRIRAELADYAKTVAGEERTRVLTLMEDYPA